MLLSHSLEAFPNPKILHGKSSRTLFPNMTLYLHYSSQSQVLSIHLELNHEEKYVSFDQERFL
jgi:hypothetical protein